MSERKALDLWNRLFSEDINPVYESHQGDLYCLFCDEWQIDTDSDNHKDDCIYKLARDVVAESDRADKQKDWKDFLQDLTCVKFLGNNEFEATEARDQVIEIMHEIWEQH